MEIMFVDGQMMYPFKIGGGEVAQSCLTLCDPMDCSLPSSSVHGVLLARILEWVAISFSRGSSRPRDQTRVFCTAGRFLLTEPPGKPPRKEDKAVIQTTQMNDG